MVSTPGQHKPIVHFVGSIPLPDAETVFRTLAAAAGTRLKRLPDGETGIRKTIRWYLDNPEWVANVKTGASAGFVLL